MEKFLGARRSVIESLLKEVSGSVYCGKSGRVKMLSGQCRNCAYGSRCLGGCPNTRLTMDGSIYGENQYCAYNLAMLRMKNRYEMETDQKKLFEAGDALVRAG